MAMLHKDMYLSLFMVHAQQVEESRITRKNRYANKARPYDGGTFKDMFEI